MPAASRRRERRWPSNWSFVDGAANGYHELRADDAGRFRGRVEVHRYPALFAAFSADGDRVGLVEVQDEAAVHELHITLQPGVHVKGRFESPELGEPIPWTNVYVFAGADLKQRPISCSSDHAEFDVVLPPGKYRLWGYGTDVESVRRSLEIDGSEPEQDLGKIHLRGSYFALHRGKPLDPWKVTAARGVPLEHANLADFRGKWLLIEFWGFW